MKIKNRRRAWIILLVYLTTTCTLLLLGYSVRQPAIRKQEFPFTITYTYRGTTGTISDVYVAEHVRTEKYIGDDKIVWSGYVKDRNRLEADFYRVAQEDGVSYFIDLNLDPGYLMGDPSHAFAAGYPTGSCISMEGEEEIRVTAPTDLEQMGFVINSWVYPDPIANSFHYGGISLSSEATLYTAIMAAAALLACLLLIRRPARMAFSPMDRLSVVLNFLLAFVAFPFILITSALSEILADVSAWQQLLYLAPALTALGIAASVTLRRMGYRIISFWVQFVGPVVFALAVWIEGI